MIQCIDKENTRNGQGLNETYLSKCIWVAFSGPLMLRALEVLAAVHVSELDGRTTRHCRKREVHDN